MEGTELKCSHWTAQSGNKKIHTEIKLTLPNLIEQTKSCFSSNGNGSHLTILTLPLALMVSTHPAFNGTLRGCKKQDDKQV